MKMYNDQNIFAKIIRKEISCEVIFEDDIILIFKDIFPVAPIHYIAIPKGQYVSFLDFTQSASNEKVAKFWQNIANVANTNKDLARGFRLITNFGNDGGQTVLHFHVHIVGGKKLGSLVVGDLIHK